MGSDAYATGQALYALSASGKIPATDPVYQKGVKYLLRTQAADGSWHVKTRSIWIQPYFESGFPYGHDQWISAAGTSWAVMALSQTVEPQRISHNLRPSSSGGWERESECRAPPSSDSTQILPPYRSNDSVTDRQPDAGAGILCPCRRLKMPKICFAYCGSIPIPLSRTENSHSWPLGSAQILI